MPYGEKTKQELLNYAERIFDFFISKNAKAVIMACNTTSSVIYDSVKDKYPLKIYPIIQSVAKSIAELPIKKIGVFATKATVSSNAYVTEIRKYNPAVEIIQIACPKWVKIVEANKVNDFESKQHIKEKVDEMLKFHPDKIILGCTHYPYLIDELSKLVSRDLFIDPSIYFANYIKKDLEINNLIKNSGFDEEIYVSSSPTNFLKSAEIFYKLNNLPKLALND